MHTRIDITSDVSGKTILATGNEAIARGAIEAGVKVASSYPGTPASEILGTLAVYSKEIGCHAEWAVNEKIALEVAADTLQSSLNYPCSNLRHYRRLKTSQLQLLKPQSKLNYLFLSEA